VSAPVDLAVRFAGLDHRTPLVAASGTFGYGREFERLCDFAALGAIATKGISPRPRAGNPVPRICETAAGMINSIGLENVGIEGFAADKLPWLQKAGPRVWVNFFGETVAEYVECAGRLGELTGVDALEMNVSCPNIKKGGVEFGVDPPVLRDLVAACRKATRCALIVKLTPNCTDIVALARAAVEGGADGLAVINTISAMAIDARRRRPRIATGMGGLSGPAIKPIALRMVFQVHRAGLGVPISGIGGVASGEDVVEFLLAGATTVQIGTQSFVEPNAVARIASELAAFCAAEGVARAADLVGALEV
jgi:dihydroorotate dehydrogenase (NAD+) catalytic subunit